MRRLLNDRIALLMMSALGLAACDSDQPSPYVIPGPTVPSPIMMTRSYVWDSADELRVWINNSVSRGDFSIRTEGDAVFIRVQLPATGDNRLRGPDLTPPFTGLRAVRVRYRWLPAQEGDGVGLLSVHADVTPTTVDPGAILLPLYERSVGTCTVVPGRSICVFTPRAGGEPSVWHTIDLESQSGRGYPAIVDARYLALWLGRRGPVTVDIDRIELVQ